MESREVEEKVKQELMKIYISLNSAQLKRAIDDKLNKLCKVYQKKNKPFQEDLRKNGYTTSLKFEQIISEKIQSFEFFYIIRRKMIKMRMSNKN